MIKKIYMKLFSWSKLSDVEFEEITHNICVYKEKKIDEINSYLDNIKEGGLTNDHLWNIGGCIITRYNDDIKKLKKYINSNIITLRYYDYVENTIKLNLIKFFKNTIIEYRIKYLTELNSEIYISNNTLNRYYNGDTDEIKRRFKS